MGNAQGIEGRYEEQIAQQFLNHCKQDNTDGVLNILNQANESEKQQLVKFKGSDDDNPAILWAASNGNVELTKALIQAGADVNSVSNDLQTPLIMAATNGNFTVVRHLIEAGANLEAKNGEGFTVLQMATAHEHLEIKELLQLAINLQKVHLEKQNELEEAVHKLLEERVDLIKEKEGMDSSGTLHSRGPSMEDLEQQVEELTVKTESLQNALTQVDGLNRQNSGLQLTLREREMELEDSKKILMKSEKSLKTQVAELEALTQDLNADNVRLSQREQELQIKIQELREVNGKLKRCGSDDLTLDLSSGEIKLEEVDLREDSRTSSWRSLQRKCLNKGDTLTEVESALAKGTMFHAVIKSTETKTKSKNDDSLNGAEGRSVVSKVHMDVEEYIILTDSHITILDKCRDSLTNAQDAKVYTVKSTRHLTQLLRMTFPKKDPTLVTLEYRSEYETDKNKLKVCSHTYSISRKQEFIKEVQSKMSSFRKKK